MHKSESGFSHIALLVIFVAALVAGSGYVVYSHNQKIGTDKGSTTTESAKLASPSASNNVTGVSSSISSIAASLNTSEKTLDSQYTSNDPTSDASLGVAATNFGGAYDANNY